MPATPPPTTSTSLFIGRLWSASGWERTTLPTAIRMRSLALSVAPAARWAWTQVT